MTFKTNISAILLAALCGISSLSATMASQSDSIAPTSELIDADTNDIRPLRGEVPIPEPEISTLPTTILQVVIILLSIVAITLLIIWLKRRAAARRIPNLQQKAIEELNQASKLITDRQSRKYSISASDIVRHFLLARFKLPATQQTTQEFITGLTTTSDLDLGPYHASLSHFLEQCDFGKFSGDNLSTSDMETLHQAAVEVVNCESATKDNNHD